MDATPDTKNGLFWFLFETPDADMLHRLLVQLAEDLGDPDRIAHIFLDDENTPCRARVLVSKHPVTPPQLH